MNVQPLMEVMLLPTACQHSGDKVWSGQLLSLPRSALNSSDALLQELMNEVETGGLGIKGQLQVYQK